MVRQDIFGKLFDKLNTYKNKYKNNLLCGLCVKRNIFRHRNTTINKKGRRINNDKRRIAKID